MKLTCYAIRPDAPPIRACPATRDWMDAVVDNHAYRCLPLVIANCHGWEILAPFGFAATWTGAERPEALTLRLDGGGAPPVHAVVSHFGYGIVTFHLSYLFRTEPGFDLFATGPVNHATLQDFEPEIVDIREAPDVEREMRSWAQRRADFARELYRSPKALKDAWQRDYFVGRTPDGEQQAHHVTRLRLKDRRGGSRIDPVAAPSPSRPGPRALPGSRPTQGEVKQGMIARRNSTTKTSAAEAARPQQLVFH